MAEYYNVTTTIGDAEIAKAIATNTKLNITHIAFGDGNGAVPTPSKTRSTLVKEVHRQAVTKYERHPTIGNWIVIETIIPSNIGGFWIREMGVIADGKLISHGSHAPFEKVADPSGVSEYRLKFTLDVRDGNVVAITLDQSLIYATQAWVEENYIKRAEIVDNLTTDDSKKPLSAKQGKKIQDEKAALSGATFTGEVVSTSSNSYRLKDAKRSVFWRLDENNLYLMKTPDNSPDAGWDETRPIMWEFKTNKLFLGADVEFSAAKGNLTGNADTASKLKTSRKINDVDFDGTQDITIKDDTKEPSLGFTPVRQGTGVGQKNNLVHIGWSGSALFLQVDNVSFDNVWPISISGSASSSEKLLNTRTVSFSGAATGSFTYNGSGNSSCLLTLANSGVVAGTYASTVQIPSITVNDKGQITGVSQQTIRSASIVQSGIVQLNNTLTSDSTDQALTASQGKKLQDEKAALSGATFTGEVVSTSSNSYRLKNAKRGVFWRLDENNLYLMKTLDNSPDGNWDDTRPIMWELKTNKIFFGSDVEFQASMKGNLTGNADTASKFQTSRNIALSGAVSGNADFDGSGNIIINAALNNFSSYKAENGYKYLGDGTILQWGRIDSDATEKNVTVTFPITFPNGCLNISMTRLSAYSTSATSEADGDALVVEGTITNYSFVANLQRFNTSTSMLRGAMWFAIGY
ncbi:phage tail protein [Acinetobacter bereziniae]|uniref:phage tail protein n=1 Tax=Acinetobacter bereziniae TaxID=106648 RepID=UPI0025749C89|nr:phage tail protein [Acinetobacter bereziniae]MDM1784261.1 phage tail protein [Acinetobacter bereziniae]